MSPEIKQHIKSMPEWLIEVWGHDLTEERFGR